MSFDREKSLKAAEKYVQQNNLKAAINEYEQIVANEPEKLLFVNTLGDLYVRAGNLTNGIEHLLRVADSYCRDGFTVKAVAMYKKISKLAPDNREINLKLADLYFQLKHLGEAKQQYALAADAFKSIGQTAKELKILKTIADIDPNNVKLRLDLAERFRQEGYPDEAHDAYLQAGQELARTGDQEGAISVFEKALAIRSDSKVALKHLVELLAQTGSLHRAVAVLSKLMGRNPNDLDLVIILGRTYLNANMLSEAEANFIRLLVMDRSRYDYLLEVSRRHLDNGDYQHAIELLDHCIDILIERQQHKKATALLKTILKRDAYNIQALKRLSYIYLQLKETRALVATLKLLIQTALKLDHKAEAIAALQQLIEIEPAVEVKAQLTSLSVARPEDQGPTDPLVETFYPLSQTNNGGKAEPAKPTPTPSAEVTPMEGTTEMLESMVKQHPELLQAQIKMLEELVGVHRDYLEARLKLRTLYLDTGQRDKAAHQCQELARIYTDKGDSAKAKEYSSEGFKLSLLVDQAESTESVSPAAAAAVAPASIESIFNQPAETGLSGQVVTEPAAQSTFEIDLNNPPAEFLAQLAAHQAQQNQSIQSSAPTVQANLSEVAAETQNEFIDRLCTDRSFDREWRRAIRYRQPFSLVLAEIDLAQHYLANYGLAAWQDCLSNITANLSLLPNRPGDEVITFGEKDFAIILPDTSSRGAVIIAEKLRELVESLRIPHQGALEQNIVTASFGVATAIPKRDTQALTIINAAQRALEKVRSAGHNRVLTS